MSDIRWYPWLCLFTCLLSVVACSGGGGGGRSPTDPGPAIVFTPDRPSTAGSIGLRSAGVNENRLILELFANQVDDISLVSFILVYPTSLLDFDGVRQGDFFEGVGFADVTQLPFSESLLVVSFSLTDHRGSGVILELDFTATASGRGVLDIQSPEAQNGDGQVLGDIDWIGGTVDIAL